jgi:hypothetical protein
MKKSVNIIEDTLSLTHSLGGVPMWYMIKYSFYKILINKQISEFEIISEKFINKCFFTSSFVSLSHSHLLAGDGKKISLKLLF